MSTFNLKKSSKFIGMVVIIILTMLMQSGCNYGFESTQEPHTNPFDPLYHPPEARLILGEPKLISDSSGDKILLPWKEVQIDSILGNDWTYTVYTFEDSEKDQVFSILADNFGDPSTIIEAANSDEIVFLEEDQDPENRVFELSIIDTAVTYYYIVKFTKTDSSQVNFSNIVLYSPAN